MKPSLICTALLAGCLMFASESHAGNCYGGNFSGLPYFGFGYSGSLYGLGYVPVPPYYALHPPVYYSQPVARPYGDSPFARRPGRVEPRPAPRVTLNPFVPQPQKIDEDTGTAVQTVSSVQVIINPYYSATETELVRSAD